MSEKPLRQKQYTEAEVEAIVSGLIPRSLREAGMRATGAARRGDAFTVRLEWEGLDLGLALAEADLSNWREGEEKGSVWTSVVNRTVDLAGRVRKRQAEKSG